MNGPVVVLDACVLIPVRLATTMLWLAEAGLFQPLWSDQILDEVRRNLPGAGRISTERAAHRVSLMRESFGAEALIEGHEELIATMRCDAKDRHVLAAAVHGGADAGTDRDHRRSVPGRPDRRPDAGRNGQAHVAG